MADSKDLYNLGSQLQKLRQQRGWTLEQAAEQSGVGASLINQLERGIGNPSFNTLKKLAIAFGVPMTVFFRGLDTTGEKVVRKRSRKRLVLKDPAIAYQLLTPDLNRALQFVQMEYLPGVSTEDTATPHEGEECYLVVKGTLEMHWGDEVYVLEAGDSIGFPAGVSHWVRNPGAKKAVAIWVTTPPSLLTRAVAIGELSLAEQGPRRRNRVAVVSETK